MVRWASCHLVFALPMFCSTAENSGVVALSIPKIQAPQTKRLGAWRSALQGWPSSWKSCPAQFLDAAMRFQCSVAACFLAGGY